MYLLNLNSSKTENLFIHGQGVFLFNQLNITKDCEIYFYNKEKNNGLKFVLTKSNVFLNICTYIHHKSLKTALKSYFSAYNSH